MPLSIWFTYSASLLYPLSLYPLCLLLLASAVDCQIPADVFEWSCSEKLFQCPGEDCEKRCADPFFLTLSKKKCILSWYMCIYMYICMLFNCAVLDDHQNPRLVKTLLNDLSSTLCILIREVGKSVLIGNINIWVCRLETILNWQQQLNSLQIPKVVFTSFS